MKKIFVVSVFAAMSLVACTEVESDMIPVNSESDNSFTITAQTESSATRAGISGSDATGYDVVWEEGDEVFVYIRLTGMPSSCALSLSTNLTA